MLNCLIFSQRSRAKVGSNFSLKLWIPPKFNICSGHLLSHFIRSSQNVWNKVHISCFVYRPAVVRGITEYKYLSPIASNQDLIESWLQGFSDKCTSMLVMVHIYWYSGTSHTDCRYAGQIHIPAIHFGRYVRPVYVSFNGQNVLYMR